MTSKISINLKNLSKNKKAVLFMLIGLFIVGITSGIIKVFAYYQEQTTSVIFANKVGDFDLGIGETNLMIYKETDDGKYAKSYGIPEGFFVFNDSLTKCTIPCNDNTGNCEYTYDEVNYKFEMVSNQKVTCKFYFDKIADPDIVVNIMVEDGVGSGNYILKNEIPAYGVVYSNNAHCDNSSFISFNSESRTFNIKATTKDTCYAYFDAVDEGDMKVNVYVQETVGSTVYTKVNSIPINNIYVLNNTKTQCVSAQDNGDAGIVTYEDGYINISSKSKQICDVYLDLKNN